MANPGDATEATGTGDPLDAIALSIAKKLGGDGAPRDDKGRFTSQRDSEGEADTAEAEEAPEQQAESEEGQEPETEEATDESEEPEEPQPQEPTFTVKVNGEEVTGLTIEDLKKGWSREADYTRNKQALAAEKAAWEATREQTLKAERDTLSADREQAQQALKGAMSYIESLFGSKEYWDTLRQQDAGRWAAERQVLNEQLQAFQKQSDEMRQKAEAKQADDLKVHRASEWNNLVKALPEWKDQAKLNEEYQKIAEYAVQVRGYKPEQLAALADDHRLVLVLKDAQAFHALSQKKPETLPKPKDVKPAKPGPAPAAQGKATQSRKAYERFKQSGRAEDLAVHLARKFNLSG